MSSVFQELRSLEADTAAEYHQQLEKYLVEIAAGQEVDGLRLSLVLQECGKSVEWLEATVEQLKQRWADQDVLAGEPEVQAAQVAHAAAGGVKAVHQRLRKAQQRAKHELSREQRIYSEISKLLSDIGNARMRLQANPSPDLPRPKTAGRPKAKPSKAPLFERIVAKVDATIAAAPALAEQIREQLNTTAADVVVLDPNVATESVPDDGTPSAVGKFGEPYPIQG